MNVLLWLRFVVSWVIWCLMVVLLFGWGWMNWLGRCLSRMLMVGFYWRVFLSMMWGLWLY